MKNHELRCRDCIAERNSVFGSLFSSESAILDRERTPHVYEPGQMIFYEGNPAFAVYCICSGLVKLFKNLHNGEERVIRLLGPGEMTGYRAVFADENYSASAQAVQRSSVCTIPKSTLFKLMHQSQDLTHRMLSKVSVELRISEEQMLSLAQCSVKQRLAKLLVSLLLLETSPATNPPLIKAPVSRLEMAQMIGTTPESLSRTLHELSAKGMIELHDADISITDLAKLQHLARGMNNGVEVDQAGG